MISDVVVELVKLFGPMGFIMWIVWRTTNHTIPRLAKSFEDALDRQRADFKEMIERQRADFKEMIAREQQTHENQTDRIITAIEESR